MPLTTPLNSRSLGWANFCPLSKLNKSIFSFGKANQPNPNLEAMFEQPEVDRRCYSSSQYTFKTV